MVIYCSVENQLLHERSVIVLSGMNNDLRVRRFLIVILFPQGCLFFVLALFVSDRMKVVIL